jgi:hypothetical protein
MTRTKFIIAAIAFVATVSVIGTAAASILPSAKQTVAVYVRKDEVSAVILISAGTHSITVTSSGGNTLTVQIDDRRTFIAIDTRTGRTASGVIIRTTTITVITQAQSGVVIED